MNRAERIAVSVAVRALKAGASDPQLVAAFLEEVLASYDDVDEVLRPGGVK